MSFIGIANNIWRATKGTGGGAGFNPATLNPFIWYDPSDISTLFQDSAMTTPVTANNDPVGAMRDKSVNGFHALQATAASRPTYKTSGSLSWIEFDGVSTYLAALFTSPNQPMNRLTAIHIIGVGSGAEIYRGSGFEGGLYHNLNLDLHIFDGTAELAFLLAATTGIDFVVTEQHDGANSKIAVDNAAYSTGNPGTTISNNINIAGLVGNAAPNFRLSGYLEFDYILSDANTALTRTYLASKQGRVL